MSGGGLALRLRGLTVTTPRGRRLLDIPALDLPAGAILGLRGASGSGKSTFLNAVSGLVETEGEVHWGGTELLSLPPARRDAFRAAHMGMIFQDFLLFEELSSLGNAALPALYAAPGDRAAIRERAAGYVSRLGLDADARSVASYSGGERQRVAVARALSNDPAVLLADEPTAALDRAAADALAGDLIAETRARGRTLLLVSHDPALLARADRVIALADGRLAS